jgi:hypothetical protein
MNALSVMSMLTENGVINVLALLFVLIVAFSFRVWKDSIMTRLETIIKYVAAVIFIGGYVVYFIGFTRGAEGEGTAGSWMAFVFRPIISSLEMFVSHSDLIEVAPEMKENALYMTFFSFFHFAAVSVTGIIAVYYLGARAISWFRWNKLLLTHKRIVNLHIFFDANEASMHLAEDIRNNDRDGKKDVILLYTCKQADGHGGEEGFNHMFNMFSFRKDMLIKAYSMNMFIKRMNIPLYHVEDNDIIKKLGLLKGVAHADNVNLYFLSEDENANILSSLKIKNDPFLSDTKTMKDKRIRLFCRSSKGGANVIFEKHTKSVIETVIVDNSYLSVWSLRTLPVYVDGEPKPFMFASHPVNFIDIDPDEGLAMSPFHAAIFGFDETGQEALRFLYEYGQFVYPEETEGSQFTCDIFDASLDKHKGRFLAKYPKLADADSGIVWHNTDNRNSAFWDGLRRNIDSLNYVVLAMGDDEKDMTLAVDIFNMAQRYRKDGLNHFGIFVRSYNFTNEQRLEEIAAVHANRGNKVIYVFGKMSDLYTKNRICDDKLENAAALFSFVYNNIEQCADDSIEINSETLQKAKEVWRDRHNNSRGSYEEYLNVLRSESQDLSNAYHIYTKMKMVGYDELRDTVLEVSGSSYVSLKRYKNLPFVANLARLEHKRWCASHYARGYMPMTEEEYQQNGASCDVIHKTHRCLVPWEKLNEFKEAPYQYYDELVVTTSFGLFYNKAIDDVYRNI